MLGAIIGDIAGSRWEFTPTNDYNFELFSKKNGFTDDTICTVAVADAILHHSDDYGKYIHDWCRKYPRPMGGYGGRFAQWVRSDHPEPYGSFGNGSAMRVSPVAWAFSSREDVLEAARLTAACTHNHPEGIKGAQTVALAIHYARQLSAGYEKTIGEDDLKQLMTLVTQFSGYRIDFRKEDVENRFNETCQGTVPVALWVIRQSDGFEDAVRRAVSLGADADTLGAIVGSIAEALWGIPNDLRIFAMGFLPDEMKTVISQFQVTTDSIKSFAERNIDYLSHHYKLDSSYRAFFGSKFPNDCRKYGFEMDIGQSFIEAYGECAWHHLDCLEPIIDKVDDINIIGSALFSKWRFFNHWSCSPPEEDDIKWFLLLFRRLRDLSE